MFKPTRFLGLVAAPYTPFQSDGALNLDVIASYSRYLRANKLSAVFVCGTTGEGVSLSIDERIQVATRWLRETDSRLPVIVHVGHTSLPEAGILIKHAARIGAAAVSAMAPYFFKPHDVGDLVDWCSALAAFAPNLPFYYYHIPSMTGVSFPMVKFLALAEKRIPSLAGIKYTHNDLEDYAASSQFAGGRYDVLFGRDELLMEGWSHQARGAVGSTYNYAAPLYLRLIAAHQAGDQPQARELQDQAIRMMSICKGMGVPDLAAAKALMAMRGIDCGPVRLPLRQPSAAQLLVLREKLEAEGFFGFACRPLAECA